MYERRNAYLERKMREQDMARGRGRGRGRDRNDMRGDNRRDYENDYERDIRSRAGNGYLNDAEVQYQMGMRDERNPYGSRGGYVRSDRSNGNDYEMDYRNDYAERDRGYDSRRNSDYRGGDYARGGQSDRERGRHMDYEMYGYGMITPMHEDYARGRGRDNNMDYARDYADMEKEYEQEIKKATEKMQKADNRVRVGKDQILRQAKNMNIKFDEFTEEEFYLVYLMMIAEYPDVTNDYNVYIKMAKNWLESKHTKLKGSDKICTYLYEIILGKSKEEDED